MTTLTSFAISHGGSILLQPFRHVQRGHEQVIQKATYQRAPLEVHGDLLHVSGPALESSTSDMSFWCPVRCNCMAQDGEEYKMSGGALCGRLLRCRLAKPTVDIAFVPEHLVLARWNSM